MISKRWNSMPPLARVGVVICMVLMLLALGLKAAGASWVNVAFAVIPLAVATLLVGAEPRLQWLTRPRPKLTLVVEGAEDGRLERVGLAPWPLDVDRIVANETAEAMDTVRDSRSLPSWLTTGVGLTSPPTREDHDRARTQFKAEVETYSTDLRTWLSEYSSAASARWETFEVSLALSNAAGAAHAEAVEVVLELPDSVDRGSADFQSEAPPVRPTYRPPGPHSLLPSAFTGLRGPPLMVSRMPDLDFDAVAPVFRPRRGWDKSSDSLRLTAPRVEVQPGRTVEIGESLWLRANGPGVHEIQWSVYSQSLGHPVSGSFKLIVPEGDPTRPPFGRVEGILRFPDVEIAREDDEEEETDDGGELVGPRVRPIRSSDPPLVRPTSNVDEGESDVLAALRAASGRWEWEALGLDPALDGPSSSGVEVRKADPQGPED